MTILGIEFDDPREFPLPKSDMRVYRDGARTTVREMWVHSYRREGSAVFLDRIQVTATNRGVCTFDGKQVKDEAAKKSILEIMNAIDFQKPV